MVAQENADISHSSYTKAFPKKILFGSYLVTLLVLIWMGISIYKFDKEINDNITKEVTLSYSVNQLSYLATSSAQSLKLFMKEGAPEWEAAYEYNNSLLEDNLSNIEQEIKGDKLLVKLKDIKSLHTEMEKLERNVIELIHQNKKEDARNIIISEAYASNSQKYSEQCRFFSENIYKGFTGNLAKFSQNTKIAYYIIIFAIIFTPFLWVLSYRAILKWQKYLEQTKAALEISGNEARLSAARAEEALKAKSLFLSNMSHELRTPMHAILNYSEMGIKQLNKVGETERLVKYLGNIQIAGKRLLALLNDLLDFSKLEAGKMDIKLKNIPLETVVEYALNELDSLLKQKNLETILQKTAANTSVNIDSDRMVQVLVNLLSNAIKYSPVGGKISFEIYDSTYNSNPSLCLSVTNQGPNIPEQDIERIFELFAQSEGSKTVGGTGLGLAICREIAKAHKGEIWASNIENGCVFYINIPTGNNDEQEYTL